MSTKTLSINNLFAFAAPEKTKKYSQKKISYGAMATSVGLIGLNVVVILSYLLGVNSYASTGYEIQHLQNNIDKLTAQNQSINLQIAEASSVVNIESAYVSANFVPTGSAKFLTLNQYSDNR